MRSRCAVVAALSLLPASLAVAQSKVPGWTYALNITVDSGFGAAKRGAMAMRYQTTASALRMEILQVAGAANAATMGANIEGSYTLINDADSTYIMVLPSLHAANIMVNPVRMMAKQDLPKVEANRASLQVEDLGAGEPILGHATHRFRIKTVGSMTVTVNGKRCTRPMDGETEVWVAPDVDITSAMRSMVSHYGFDVPDSGAYTSSGMPMKGVPLRTKVRSVVKDASGGSRTIETTVEYVELSNAPLDSALFTVPADYRVMDMRKQMAGLMEAALDSVRARSAVPLAACE